MNAVQMTSKMYDCRDAAKRLLGEHYHRDIGGWSDLIRVDARLKKCSELAAATALVKEKPDDPFRTLVILAAYVEMVEPSSNAQANRRT